MTRDAVLTVVSRATTIGFGLGMLAGGGRLDGLSVAYLCGASVGPAVGGIWLQASSRLAQAFEDDRLAKAHE